MGQGVPRRTADHQQHDRQRRSYGRLERDARQRHTGRHIDDPDDEAERDPGRRREHGPDDRWAASPDDQTAGHGHDPRRHRRRNERHDRKVDQR
jgi:hypothetical protein